MADDSNSVALATELTIAWLGNHNTRVHADDVPAFLARMHDAVVGLTAPEPEPSTAEPEAETHTPAVSVRKSVASPEHIISMIDGKPYRSLRRHLAANGLTPDDYRARFGLKADYPMVAPAYSEARRAMAKALGLGRKAAAVVDEAVVEPVKAAIDEAVVEPVKAVAKRARKGVSDAKKAAQAHLGGKGQE